MLLIIAVASMLLAVSFYTTGVIWEKKSKSLNRKHLIIFYCGLVFDTIGTTAMGRISSGFTLDIHGITGLVALILMLLHVLWATWVYLKGTDKEKMSFHKYSLLVWLFWLIPFFIGMIINM